jgi:hypothetical protein
MDRLQMVIKGTKHSTGSMRDNYPYQNIVIPRLRNHDICLYTHTHTSHALTCTSLLSKANFTYTCGKRSHLGKFPQPVMGTLDFPMPTSTPDLHMQPPS